MTDASVTTLNTSQALQRLARGRDAEAWNALIERHGADILRTAARITPDAALREDICQETLLQIRAHAGAFDARGSGGDTELLARAWIMRVACCTALKMIRTRTRAANREQIAAPAAAALPVATPPERVVAREEAETVRREVAALPEANRDAISLRFFGELAYAEIGAILKISEEAAKKRVQRGLDLLRARLAAGGMVFSAALLLSALQQNFASAAEAVALGAGGNALGAAGSTGSALNAAAPVSEAAAQAAQQAVQDVTLDLSRQAAWQALVNSSQAPA